MFALSVLSVMAAQACCRAFTPECLACVADQTVAEYCATNPDVCGTQPTHNACEGFECPADMGVRQNVPGCPRIGCTASFCCEGSVFVPQTFEPAFVETVEPEHKVCCRAYNAECLACSVDSTVEDFCATAPSTPGCPSEQPTTCCHAFTADCLACQHGQTIVEFCANINEAAELPGCPQYPTEPCCFAFTAECLACQFGQTVPTFCANINEADELPGCPRDVVETCDGFACPADTSHIGEADVRCVDYCTVEQCCFSHPVHTEAPVTDAVITKPVLECSEGRVTVKTLSSWKVKVVGYKTSNTKKASWKKSFKNKELITAPEGIKCVKVQAKEKVGRRLKKVAAFKQCLEC